MANNEDTRRSSARGETGVTDGHQRQEWSARRSKEAGLVVVSAGLLATIGALMQWYAPARAFIFPDLSGVGLSGGVVLLATIGLAGLGLAIALSGRVQAALLAAVAGTALLAAAFLTVQNVAALNQVPSGVRYTLEIGVWMTAMGGALGLLGSLASLTRWFRV